MSDPQPSTSKVPPETPPIGVSAQTVQKYRALLSEWSTHTQYEQIASQYKIQGNGKTFRVMKRCWYGWRQVRSSVCHRNFRGGCCDGVSHDDAFCAKVEQIVRDLEELSISPYRDV